MLVSFSVLHWQVMRYLEDYIFEQLNTQLLTQLKNIEHNLDLRNEEIIYLVRTLSTDLSLPRALEQGSSRGVNQTLNRTVEIYPFIRYVLLVDNTKEIFSSSTRNRFREKISGENVIGLDLGGLAIVSSLLTQTSSISPPIEDPLYQPLGIERKKIQWHSSPVKKRGEVIGWLIACYDWRQEMDSLIDHSKGQLLNAEVAVMDLSLWKADGTFLSAGLAGKIKLEKHFVTKISDFKSIKEPHYLSISVDRNNTLGKISNISKSLQLFFVITGCVVFCLLYAIIDLIVIRRIKTIERGAENIRSGNIDYRIEKRGEDEIAHLALVFNEMAEYLKSTWENLENNVTERNVQLHKSNEKLKIQTLELIDSEKGLKSQTEELKKSNLTLEKQKQSLARSETKLKTQREQLKDVNEALTENQIALLGQAKALKDANKQIQQKAKDLEKSNLYKTEFLANMSHELRTPLNSLLILSKTLAKNKEENLTPSQMEDAVFIHEGGEELLEIINDILDLTKVEAGVLAVHANQVRLLDLGSALQAKFAPVAQQKNIAFIVEYDKELSQHIQSDGKRIEQIIKNFLSNAFKFSKKGPVILRIFNSHQQEPFHNPHLTPSKVVGFSVIDSGIGIHADKQSEVFEAFQQEDGSISRKYGGTGLGLSIARQLALLLHGEITLSSVPDKGSTFTLFLPLMLDPAAQEENISNEPNNSFQTSATNNTSEYVTNIKPKSQNSTLQIKPKKNLEEYKVLTGKRILLVDDNMKSVFVLSKQLADYGMDTTIADNGLTALNKVKLNHFDIIVMDIMMPTMDGYEAIREIRKINDMKSIPIIAFTANSIGSDSAKCLEAGASEFVTKPIDIDLFREKIEALLHL